MQLRYCLFLILMLSANFCFGQQKEFVLKGKVVIKNGPTCPYIVTFKVNGNVISGKSITTQENGSELTALINGIIDQKSHSLLFKESKMPLSFDIGSCLFNVALTYKIKAGQYIFRGTFTGSNNLTDSCDEGTVYLETKQEHDGIFLPKKKEKKPEPKVEQAPEEKEPLVFNKITATVKKEISWHTDTCTLEIWDGEVVDGDMVTIQLNGQVVLSAYALIADKKKLRLPLTRKVNTITITADNEGKAPPNTAMILLTDGTNQTGILSCVKKGETAEVIIRRGH